MTRPSTSTAMLYSQTSPGLVSKRDLRQLGHHFGQGLVAVADVGVAYA